MSDIDQPGIQPGISQHTNQQRINRLMDALPGIVFVTDNDPGWSPVYLSAGCQRLTGYRSDELTGPDRIRTYNSIIHPADLPRLVQSINQAIAQQQPYVCEYRIQTRSGTERWMWEKGCGVFDPTGHPQGLEGFITDITDLKQAEDALRCSEARYRSVVNNSKEVIFQTDARGIWTFLSPVWTEITGFPIHESLGRNILNYIHPDDQAILLELFQADDPPQQDHYRHETRYMTYSGQCRWLEVSIRLQRDEAGQLCGTSGTLNDITHRHQSDLLQQSQKRVLEMIATHRNLTEVLMQLVELIDTQDSQMAASILLLDEDGQHLRLGAAVRLPDYYNRMVDGIQVGPKVGSCGTAVYRRHPVITVDILTDPLWEQFRDLAISCGLRACWSIPILSSQRQVLGTFAFYHQMPSSPTPQDWQLIETVSHLAGIAIEQHQAKATLAKREHYLASLVDVQRHLLVEDLEIPYDAILASLGMAAGASRVYVFKNSQDATGQLLMSQTAEWCADGVASEKDNPALQNCPYFPNVARWARALSQGQKISGIVAEFPASERAILEPQQILSILVLPLIVNGEFVGFIGFDNCHTARLWETTEVDLLQAAAGTIALKLERLQTRVALEQAESKYREIFENAVEGIFQSSPEGRYLTANPMLSEIYGYDSPADLMEAVTDISQQIYLDPCRRDQFVTLMQRKGAVWGFESEVYRKDGSTIWISESARAMYDDRGILIGYEGTVEDISRRKQAEADLRKRDNLLQGVAAATSCLLTNSELTVAIPQVLEILGQSASTDRVYIYENHPHPETGEVSMSMRFEWVNHEISASITQSHWQNRPYATFGLNRWYATFLRGQSIKGRVREFPPLEQSLLRRDQILSILMVPIFVEEHLWGYIGFDECQVAREWSGSEESILVAIAASIGEAIRRQRTEAKMRYQAFHDALTGLPNRTLFNQQLDLALNYAHRNGETLGVMFLDLDRFKTINDTLGHAVGDLLLQQATRRLTSCLREEDLIARWGGDEFTLMLPQLNSPDAAAQIAQRIATALKPAFYLDNQELFITCSMGIALYPHNGSDADTLLKQADAALYRAKEQGRNNYQFYTVSINPQASELLTLDHSLHRALEQNEFLVYYQPQFNVDTGEIVQMEALLRWQHPRIGIVSPATFISLAEENGLIIPIGEWVLRVACTQTKVWQAMGAAHLRIAVNLSARQFQQPNLVDQIAQILHDTQLSPASLELEITETAVMQDLALTRTVLQELRDMGVRIAMDDFGTGYSSLSYLKQFPLHALKIDRSFVRDLTENPQDQAIVSTIITLGHGLNLTVIAEGVETQSQMEQLRSLSCPHMQGYWFSKPLGALDATQMIQQHYGHPSSAILPTSLSAVNPPGELVIGDSL